MKHERWQYFQQKSSDHSVRRSCMARTDIAASPASNLPKTFLFTLHCSNSSIQRGLVGLYQ